MIISKKCGYLQKNKTMYSNDKRVVLTLDAGGTNFVYSAVQGNKIVAGPITKDSYSDNLDLCLAEMVDGFQQLWRQLKTAPIAISFAFPGPADYPNGVIGGGIDLMNMPAFNGGVALGAFLEETFKLPVFINNDADLFAYGEALGGALPELNGKLQAANSRKQFRNLIGVTLGTGFGMGFVSDGKLHIGDNSCVEVYCLPHKHFPDLIVEEGVSVRGICRLYSHYAGDERPLTPKQIFEIAEGKLAGNADAARQAFQRFGEITGSMIAYAASMIDGIIVLGGGLTKAHKYFMPALLQEVNAYLKTNDNQQVKKVPSYIYDLDDEAQFAQFVSGDSKTLQVYGSDRIITYHPHKRLGIMRSKIGASEAVALGAYAYALQK
jgi:predicted NBD/HSP70 family sugar kinase